MLKLSEPVCRRRPLVVLLGPTAVGKSRLGVQVARQIGTEVLTADSRQVYRGMDIGTDKPTEDERHDVPHRLIDLADPDETFNTGWYRRAALAEIDRLYAAGRLPFVVGGTGLYIRTLVRGLCPAPPADPLVRGELMRMCKEQGRDGLYAELAHVDPVTAAWLHPNDEAKVMRALEVYRLSGQPMSALQRQHGFQEAPFSALLIGLQRPKEELYRRIEERIDWQLAHGMVQETRALLDRGYGRESGAMTGLGYRHVAAHVSGEYDYAEMVRLFKRDTRRFAKRQMTWFRKEPGVRWIAMEQDQPLAHTVRRIVSLIEEFLGTVESGAMPATVAGKGQA
ncbi:MAG: tRNA (adenosine(37)-N6)-dimethylallyltransferase MiaA [Nitrospira sp.]|nr:tRNA (adenosine(37)-N6)-dimethylallyltransferase MiaA [Nitrospira sp.]